MDLVNISLVAFVVGVATLLCLWLFHKFAPSQSASRLQAKYGLPQIYPASGEPTLSKHSIEGKATTDVVFVHGLGADPAKTWHDGDICWITDLFSQDLKAKGLQHCVRLFAFNYQSFWVREANSTSLRTTAISLGRELKSGNISNHDLLLVGHSYGGLVIKKALVLFPDLKPRVKGILFLGTPHRGTPFSRFGIAAARILTSLDADVDIMRSLVSDNIDLDSLEKDFGVHFRETTRRYYFETHKIRRYLLGFVPCVREFVVPYQSATFGADASEIIPLYTDHRGLNKFRDRNSNYWEVARELLNILQENSRNIPEVLRSAIDTLVLDDFLPMLSGSDQEEYLGVSTTRDLDHDPIFHWIFRNIDYSQWSCLDESGLLWICGPPKCNIHRASSYIVDQQRKPDPSHRFVLYFFCSSAAKSAERVGTIFVHAMLKQFVTLLPSDKKMLVVRRFLLSLVETAFREKANPPWETRGFEKKDSEPENLKRLLDAPEDELMTALNAALGDEEERGLSIVIDGLDKADRHGNEFTKRVLEFFENVQLRSSKTRVLLTSKPLVEIKVLLDKLPHIEYDRERNDCLASLRFDNTRHAKITPEYRGSCEWIWKHPEYKKWCLPGVSGVLLVQGKPGSGKSTLAKYVSEQVRGQEEVSPSAIVAKFFYSYREGELQRTHYNMLRTILHDILRQDEPFFYHCFQSEYRRLHLQGPPVAWDYELLKTLLRSLQDYSAGKPLYLIIDAVDESEENDRKNILDLILGLQFNCVAKIFVASRPTRHLDIRRGRSHFFIKLQDETKPDIDRLARSFLKGLKITHVIEQAAKHIVDNAHGVFIWVKLVGEKLQEWVADGYSEEEIYQFLESLPTELEAFYGRMFKEMGNRQHDLQSRRRIFQFVLFGRRPLAVEELLHALGVEDGSDTKVTLSHESFQKRIPTEPRVTSLGGKGTVQVMHQTVHEFFLDPRGIVADSGLRIRARDAHICISTTCIRYLTLYAANVAPAGRPPEVEDWTLAHFTAYAQYLDEFPLANYALRYLQVHIDGCQQGGKIGEITTNFIDALTHEADIYLLEKWVCSNLNRNLLSAGSSAAAKVFRYKVFREAIKNGLPTATGVVLAAGADVDVQDENGCTALHLAAQRGHEAVSRVLIVEGSADVNMKDKLGWTALHHAAESGYEAVTRVLITEGSADVSLTDGKGRTALHKAAGGGHVVVTRVLIAEGPAYVSMTDMNGQTALHSAAGGGHEEVARVLIVEGSADVSLTDKNRQTALHHASKRGHDSVVQIILATATASVNLDYKDKQGRTSLWWAARNGHAAVVEVLLRSGRVDTNMPEEEHRDAPLVSAAMNGHESVVRTLLSHDDTSPDIKDRDGQTPLWWAAKRGHGSIVQLLLARRDVDINAMSNDGRVPLFCAAEERHSKVFVQLRKKGADLEVLQPYGYEELTTTLARFKIMNEWVYVSTEHKDDLERVCRAPPVQWRNISSGSEEA